MENMNELYSDIILEHNQNQQINMYLNLRIFRNTAIIRAVVMT